MSASFKNIWMVLSFSAVAGWALAQAPATQPTTSAPAGLKLPAVVSDSMVLQREMAVPIWGWAKPGEAVQVKLGQETAAATADAAGKWQVKIKAPPVGGPYEMSVAAGGQTLTVKDILVGEVWVCSGQSNMEWTVGKAMNATEEIAKADQPQMRLFTVAKAVSPTPLEDCKGQWLPANPKTVPNFSAVGYFFGRNLQERLKMPIGLIHTSWGGTPADAWTPLAALAGHPGLAPSVERFESNLKNYPELFEKWKAAKKAWDEKMKQGLVKENDPNRPREPQGPNSPHRPACLYNAMIAPLVPYGIRGAIWYQGESNAGRAEQYRTLLPTMIKSWRASWAEGDFPFLIVQLANFMAPASQPAGSEWAELREAQAMTTTALPNVGLAVAIDIGEEKDIHPKNKQEAGRRLALAAAEKVYGDKVVGSGPIFDQMKVEGDTVRLTFKSVGGGLVAKGGVLKGFALAAEDKKFVWAEAKVDGNTVVVKCAEVSRPVAVRYNWANNPDGNLYNAEGLPAVPFRTDTWPGLTAGRK